MKNKIDNKIYLKKEINVDKFPEKKNIIQKLINLYQNPKIKDNKCILKLLCINKKENKINLIYDYFPNGNLYDYINEKGPFSEENSFVIFYQILITIEFFHKQGIILRNISPKKILLGDKFRIYFYDFSEIINLEENINKNLYSYEEDIIPLGFILQILINGLDNEENALKKQNNKNNDYDRLIYDLINTNIIKTISDIYNYSWIKLFLNDPNQIILSRFREFTKNTKQKYKNNNIEESFHNDIPLDSYTPIKTTNDTNSNRDYLDILHNNYDIDYYNDSYENFEKERNFFSKDNNNNYDQYSQYSYKDKNKNNFNLIDSNYLSQDYKSENYVSNSQKEFFKAVRAKPKKKIVLHTPEKSFWKKFGDFFGGNYCQ